MTDGGRMELVPGGLLRLSTGRPTAAARAASWYTPGRMRSKEGEPAPTDTGHSCGETRRECRWHRSSSGLHHLCARASKFLISIQRTMLHV